MPWLASNNRKSANQNLTSRRRNRGHTNNNSELYQPQQAQPAPPPADQQVLLNVKLATVVGARPQFPKAAALGRALRQHDEQIVIHTGQHYDEMMSDVFFRDLGMPEPDVNLGVGSGSHGVQTARMLEGIEAALQKRNPDLLVVFGDTNSTIAGALAAGQAPDSGCPY